MKRGQEELVGFVAIMILLGIVFLVFLTFSLRSPQQDIRENSDAYYFLASSMEVTSECAIGINNRLLTVAELFPACRQDQLCVDGRTSCDVMNSTLIDLVERGFKPGPETPVQGYELTVSYERNASLSQGEVMLDIKNGVCNSSIRGASYAVPTTPGLTLVELKLCS